MRRKLHRVIAIFLLIQFVGSSLAPTISWALTAGPTAPEFSSFEPVDTTDMVNLATGEFVYNTPILEVPGPSGGYPLSLSYHAGIRPDMEASWVGLGFSLNPGAINRTVSGFADDNITSRRDIRDYWQGGSTTTKTYTLGLNGSIAGFGMSYTLATSQDTYKGFSSSLTVSRSINPLAPLLYSQHGALTGNTGILRKGEKWLPAAAMREKIFQETMSSISAATSVNLDVNISSTGIKANASIAGYSLSQRNANSGRISTLTHTKNIGTISFYGYGFLSLREFYTRYWSDQSDVLFGTGTLYPYIGNSKLNSDGWARGMEDENDEFQSYAFDTYNLYDRDDMGDNDDADASKQVGGTLPAYDRYSVVAQGLGGTMQPHIFENGDLHGQNTYWQFDGRPILGQPTLKHHALRSFTAGKKVDFRFLGDFSNSLTVAPSQIADNGTSFSVQSHSVQAEPEGFDNTPTAQRLAGSKHIEWFTNQEIVEGVAQGKGFIDCYSNANDRPLEKQVYRDYLQPEACIPFNKSDYHGRNNGIIITDTYEETDIYTDIVPEPYWAAFSSLKPDIISLAEKIGGFMITSESGVTYHYAQPVYASNEYTRTKLKKPEKDAATITENKNEEPYAYTWLLTAVTGPDYVDRGGEGGSPNGTLDDADWGYWVKFDYGKWTNSYQWRTPFTGYMSDVESEYESFSYGIKELYYLDAIETKSHKAIFIKSKRKDGKGVTSRLEGGSNPRRYTMTYMWDNNEAKSGQIKYSVSPVSTMKLDAIYLFDKRVLGTLNVSKSTGIEYKEAPEDDPYSYEYQGDDYIFQVPYSSRYITIKQGEDAIKVSYHNGDEVFDASDIENVPDFLERATKVIEFQTDYSLSKGVPNSIGYFSDYLAENPSAHCYLPPMGAGCIEGDYNFDFEWPIHNTQCTNMRYPYCCNFMVGSSIHGYTSHEQIFYSPNPLSNYSNLGNNCTAADGPYSGDQLAYMRTGKLTLKSISVLGNSGVQMIPPTTFVYGRNPGYSGLMYDEWGFYKSDYSNIDQIDPESSSITSPFGVTYRVTTSVGTRRITGISSLQVDAWSLTQIKVPTGSTIDITYEPNTSSRSVYNDFNSFGVEKLVRGTTDKVKVYFREKGIDLNDYFNVGQSIGMRAFIVYDLDGPGVFQDNTPGANQLVDLCEISQIDEDNIVINSHDLFVSLGPDQIYIDPGSGELFENPDPYFLAGLLTVPDITPKYVGGIRVNRISLNTFNDKVVTVYLYNVPGTAISSGITSYKPYNQVGIKFPTEVDFFDKILSDADKQVSRKKLLDFKTQFQKRLNEPFADILTLGREIPAPGAIYEYVTVKRELNDVPADSYTIHHFKPFNETMTSLSINDYGTSSKQRRNISLSSTAIDVGNLLDVSTYATSNNELLSRIVYGYLYDDIVEEFEQPMIEQGQGVVEQSFQKNITVQYVLPSPNCVPGGNCTLSYPYRADKSLVTKRKDRSNVLTSVREFNYKTGVSATSYSLGFDYYTGMPLKSMFDDGYGGRFITETIPAYTKYPDMGLKTNAQNPVGRKHMLTQSAGVYTYKVDPLSTETKMGLVSASVQTWSNQIDVLREAQQPTVWRKKASYAYVGDNTIPLGSDGLIPLNNELPVFTSWNGEGHHPYWEQQNDITLYDVFSHALEASDINGNFAATKMSADETWVLATAANSRYEEFSYSGAEDIPVNEAFGGNVQVGLGTIVTRSSDTDFLTTHTGNKALRLNDTTSGFLYNFQTEPGRAYHASVWVNSSAGRMKYKYLDNNEEGTSSATLRQAGDWFLVELEIPARASSTGLEIWCETSGAACNFDDFRVHPLDAAMISYVYNKWGELSHILDNNNLYSEFEYDGMGRLVKVYKESFQYGRKQTSETEYHYANR